MPEVSFFPIKVVFPQNHEFTPDTIGGGQWEPFEDVDKRVRGSLSSQVRGIKRHFGESFQKQKGVPAVAKVTLKPEAVAKTYRPTEILGPHTCPIIGANKLGELYVSASPGGLDRLADQLEHATNKKAIAHISTLREILPYTIEDALGKLSIDDVLRKAVRREELRLRVRLFRHHSAAINQAIDQAFRALAAHCKAEVIEELNYADGIRVFCLKNVPKKSVVTLAGFAGTQSLSPFPVYGIVKVASHARGTLTPTHFPGPVAGRSYPVVGIIDSGTDPNNALLQAWVVGRDDVVPRRVQNNEHGSFVAGLVVHGRRLNNGDGRFPDVSAKIVDVVAFDRDGEVDEYDLIPIIDAAIAKFPDVRVWNLSLSLSDAPCTDHEVSEIAAALDDRSRRHGILFVVAAGNYREPPFRTWPPQNGLTENDRICPPADAVRALTVGSVAHLDSASSRVRQGEPSPFTRRGPGPAYLIKPEVAYFGGNCDANGGYLQTGVVSINGRGQLAENAGTSFAAPLAASLAANIHHELSVNPASATPSMVKALAVHAAFIQNAPLDQELINYMGVGTPPSLGGILRCTRTSCTLILDVTVRAQLVFGKRPFPMPSCLIERGRGFVGEVFMTLMYDPPMVRGFGIEYCRCNVTASLGVMRRDKNSGKAVYKREIEPAPRSLNAAYEQDLVKHGYKWSPMKLFHRRLSRGPSTTHWRLTLEMLTRAQAPLREQPVVLILTVRDPKGQAPVHEEMIAEIIKLNWLTQDLALRSRLRIQT